MHAPQQLTARTGPSTSETAASRGNKCSCPTQAGQPRSVPNASRVARLNAAQTRVVGTRGAPRARSLHGAAMRESESESESASASDRDWAQNLCVALPICLSWRCCDVQLSVGMEF